jgi:hypothetical protein
MIDGVFMAVAGSALIAGGFIRIHSESGQYSKLPFRGASDLARRVNVFDPHKPTPTAGAGVEKAPDRDHQRAEVQIAGG